MRSLTHRTVVLVCTAVAILPASVLAADTPYDLVLRNGKIVDGSGNPWFSGDVAVRGDRIVAVGRVPPGPAKRELDAKGLVIAPGFIDMHAHSDYLLLEDGHAQSKIRQGVTTEVLGEGRSAGPFRGKLTPRRAVINGKEVQWETLGGYFDTLEKGDISVNVASYVGLDNVWEGVMGTSHKRPSIEQKQQMKALLEEALKDGAFGLSTMLAMPPGSLATTDDHRRPGRAVPGGREVWRHLLDAQPQRRDWRHRGGSRSHRRRRAGRCACRCHSSQDR